MYMDAISVLWDLQNRFSSFSSFGYNKSIECIIHVGLELPLLVICDFHNIIITPR